MGWRLRRSIGIGKLFRINFSKFGVGWSFGIPGFRISIGADKKIRRTIGIPWTGLYKTDIIGNLNEKSNNNNHANTNNKAIQNPIVNNYKCSHCGSEIDITREFCTKCGTKIDK